VSAAAASEAGPTDLRADSAQTFLNSLGVKTHVDQGYDPNADIGPLRYLGIRNVRDGERHVDGEVAIARATGVHFVITGGGDLQGLIASAKGTTRQVDLSLSDHAMIIALPKDRR
jgi:hypothetical protein